MMSPANVIVITVLPGMVPHPAVITLINVNNALLVSKAHVPVTYGILQLNSGTWENSKKPFAKYFTMIWPPGATAPPTLVRMEIVADESMFADHSISEFNCKQQQRQPRYNGPAVNGQRHHLILRRRNRNTAHVSDGAQWPMVQLPNRTKL
jgi:hypothetical protein